ncbi:MAG TPA: Holliday junction resolvase RuvX [Sphingobacteriaceae bacterium]
MPRIMSFDYGTKRVGIAVTDPLQIIATGLDTVHPKEIIKFLTDYLQKETVELFIVGEPKQMDGTASQSSQHVKGFITLLKRTFPQIPIETIDERFTSKMASATIAQSGFKKSDRRDKSRIDTISATIILQSYLQKKSFGF